MASTAIDKLRANARMSRLHHSRELAKYKHTMFSTSAAGVLGFAESKGHKLPAVIPGVEGEVSFGFAALFLASYAQGPTAQVFQSLADSLLAVGMYKLGKRAGSTEMKGVSDAHSMDALLTAAAASMQSA
jgi:hypothetical protein